MTKDAVPEALFGKRLAKLNTRILPLFFASVVIHVLSLNFRIKLRFFRKKWTTLVVLNPEIFFAKMFVKLREKLSLNF
jgi:hypothetical protein